MPEIIIDLDDPRAHDPARVGAKAACLARLRAAGEPVLPGVVVVPRHDALDAARRVIDALGDVALAVRSSSTIEDSTRASSAGLFLTVLDVRGLEAVADAIERVRASANAPGARSDARAPTMAVLVMPLVRAERAGVAFSANPVTGDAEVVIEAVFGLADALAAGQVPSQRIVVRPDGVHLDGGNLAVLDSVQAQRVAELALRVATRCGRAQDIEWAMAGDELTLLQARPITALPVAPMIHAPTKQTWIREDDHYGRPLLPFEFCALPPRMDEASRIVYAEVGYPVQRICHRLIGGWPYVRVVPLVDFGADPVKPPPPWAFGACIRLVPSLRRRLRRAAEIVDGDWARRQITEWNERGRPAARARIDRLLAVDLASIDDSTLALHLRDALDELRRACIDHVRLTAVMLLTWGRLGILCERELGWDDARVADLVQGFSSSSIDAGQAIEALTRTIECDRAARALLATPWQLAQHRGPGGTALRRYLATYGHRVIAFELSRPTPAEDPGGIIDLVRRGLDAPPRSRPDVRARADEAADQARGLVRARPQILALVEDAMAEARAARPLGDQTEELVARALAPTRYAAVAAGARLARAGRLAEPEAVFLLRPDELAQALRGEPITADVERRLAEFRWALSHRGPPRYGPAPTDFPGLRFVPRWARPFLEVMRWVLPRVAPPAGTPPSDTGTLQGIAASPGRAAGRVRIVVSPGALSRIEPGDVLVAPSAWAEWSVAFPLIRALITERGGALSHPAILAREFGIPAVLNVAEATERLREGERVVVDGTTGTVRRESS